MKNQDILIVHPESEEQVAVVKAFLEELKIKFEYSNEENYNSESYLMQKLICSFGYQVGIRLS